MRWVISLLIASPIFALTGFAGDLYPPGIVSPTMKSLDQVEPRTPIASLPYVITAPGSYYLTKDLGPLAAEGNGIVIQANNVSIDLNGFSLTGAGKDAPYIASGIVVSAANNNITVFNGTVREWPNGGLEISSPGSSIHHIRAYNNGTGIMANSSAAVTECTCINNATGISGAGIVSNNVCNFNTIGILAGDLITQNQCNENTTSGIQGNYGSNISGNTCISNGQNGIKALSGSNVTNNSCQKNLSNGIEATYGVTISGNNCSLNREDGIMTMDFCRITANTCWQNGLDGDGAGIHLIALGNSVQENHCTQNDIGLDVDTAGNYSCQNTFSNNTTNIEGAHTQGTGDLANVSF